MPWRTGGTGEPAETAHTSAGHALTLLQDWLARPALAPARLVLLTRGAVATGPDETVTDLPAAAVWGLVRSAQSENPDRFLLVDADADDEGGADALSTAAVGAATGAGETQLALRAGRILAPRLTRLPQHSRGTHPEAGARFDSFRTVLVTGATGTVGAAVTRHLVTGHGVRHLLLVGRRGATAPGAVQLAAELRELGARVTIAACDVADRTALADLLSTLPEAHPLGAVVHAAGVLDDGVISSLTPERIATVLRPKADAAVNLDRLTRDLDLSAFVLFSSAAATFGGPGQGNYAAGNAFLEALAHRRRAEGRPAMALGWGMWAERSEMSARLDEADRRRMDRGGVGALPTEAALALFDRCLARTGPYRSRYRSMSPRSAEAARRLPRCSGARRPARQADRGPGGRTGHRARPGRRPDCPGTGRAPRPDPRPGTHRDRRRPRPHLGGPGRRRPGLRGPRPGLPDLPRTAQRARPPHRTAAAGHAGLRPPHTLGRRRLPADGTARHRAGVDGFRGRRHDRR
ncbi:SDR family NAD(P)-dependent oxidoreductase [Streptomyces sioyaensis]|nr:SDR family NAD(P)-dependent oxidoreductase [Streptomyces sioyaensis]